MTNFLEQQIQPITPELLAMLEARGLEAEAMLRLDLGIGASTKDLGAMAVPFFDGGRFASVQILNPKTMGLISHLCPSSLPYNMDAVRAAELATQPLFVVDDLVSCWAALMAGYARTIAISPWPKEGAGALVPYQMAFQEVREVVICTYGDDAGNAQRERLASLFGRPRCKWVRYPDGCFSLSDAFRKFKVEGVQEIVRRAEWMILPEIYSIADLPEPPNNPAFDTGIVGLWEHYRLRRGDLCVVSGVPGAGKTSFVNEVAGRMALAHGWRTVFASFEQRPIPDHRRAFRTFHGQKLEKHLSEAERAAADAWICNHFRFLVPDDETETSLDWLLERMAAAVLRFGADMCIIDPWNELEHDRPRDLTQTEYTGMAIRRLKRFAKAHRVHVIVVAHPAKMMRGRDGKYPQPTLYDIADSAHWANKPDVGLLIWRQGPEAGLPTQIIVAKSRYHSEIGRPGQISGIWNESTGRYTITDDGTGSGSRP
jgi:twinkle protein